MCRRQRAEERAEAGARQHNLAHIGLGTLGKPVAHRFAGGDPVVHAEVDAEHRQLVLARPVDVERGKAAIEEAVAVQRGLNFLVAVHAGDVDHHRELAALVVRRQVEPRRQRGVLERNPDGLDLVVRHRGVLGVALALLEMAGDVRFVVLIVRPLRRAPIHRRHEIVIARGDLVARLLRSLRLGLAAARHRLEGRRDVAHLLDALANADDVRGALRPARRADIDRARLVPVDAVGANGVVEQPALLLKPLHVRLAALVHDRLRYAFHEIPPVPRLGAAGDHLSCGRIAARSETRKPDAL